jgi:hypothetical protein
MEPVVAVVTILVQVVTGVAIGYGLWRSIRADRAASVERSRALVVATAAATHARVTATKIAGLVGTVEELKANTDGIQAALNVATREAGEAAGEKRGIDIGREQMKE